VKVQAILIITHSDEPQVLPQ